MRSALLLALVPAVAFAGVDPFEGEEGSPPIELGEVQLEEWLELPIVSVSLQEEKASQAPASVFVLSGDDLRAQGFRTLGEVLRTVPGLFVVPDTCYSNIGVRGLSLPGDQTTRFLVMIDGQPVNNAVGIGQSYVDRELPVGLQAIERIEVIQGPIGGVYGPVAFQGAVNFVTRKTRELAAEVLLSGEANSLGVSGGEVAGTVTGRFFDQLELLAHVGGYRSRGGTFTYPEWSLFEDRVPPEGNTVRGVGWLLAENALVRLGWKGLSLTAGYAHRKKNLASAPYGTTIGDPRQYYDNQNIFTSLSWEKQLDIFGVLLRAGFQDAIYGDDLGYEGPTGRRSYLEASSDQWVNAEARVTISPMPQLRLVGGALGQYHWTRQLYGYADEQPYDVKVNFATLNLYALLEWRPFAERLLVQAGVNWSSHGLYGDQLTPRLATVLQVTQTTTAKLFVSGGFRHPTLFEGYYQDTDSFVINPGLTGDSALSVEASLEQQLARWMSAGLTLFDTTYNRLIMQHTTIDETTDGLPGPGSTDVGLSFLNLPSFQVYGAQLFVDVRHSRVRLWGGVSLQDTQSTSALTVPGFANLTGNLTLSTNVPYKPLTLAFSGVLIGPRFKAQEQVVPGTPAWVPWGGSFQVSARLQLPWVKGLAVQLTVQNILGHTLLHPVAGDYAPITATSEPELLGRLSVEWRY